MIKPNREKVTAALALLIFLIFGAYALLRSQVTPPRSYSKLDARKFNEGSADLLPIEPRLHVEDLGGTRNPFHFSSDWKTVTPEPLPLPPLGYDRRPQVLFGALLERGAATPVLYQAAIPKIVEGEELPVRRSPQSGSTQPGPTVPEGPTSTGGGGS